MSDKKIIINVGIPAYNEENNIADLIKDLLNQRIDFANLEKIIIISDASTDKTAVVARRFRNHNILIIGKNKRKGKAARSNEIIKISQSDILILLDADIAIKDHKFLEKLIKPLVAGQAEMTSSAIAPLSPRTFFEKILFVSAKLKEVLYSQFKNGNNIYTCYGPARAFSKKFYQKLNFLTSEGEDMFSYFSCLDAGFKFKNIPQAVTYYRLPSTFTDHRRQSIRYHRAQKNMNKYFNEKIILEEQTIPVSVYLKSLIKALPIILKHPQYISLYLLILGYMKIISRTKYQVTDSWNVSTSKLVRSSS